MQNIVLATTTALGQSFLPLIQSNSMYVMLKLFGNNLSRFMGGTTLQSF